eukprot:GHVR01027481.1.p2 GENE.GHVR01027481.1~~GHVR01027481.1.p2  ORF type:complete len:154 (+),score=24.50 GHVR01027481.1:76-537(+)
MILDERTEFADATSVGTPNNTTVNVGDLIDLTTARDVGNGQPLYMIVQVTTAITSGGSAIVNFQLVSDATTTVAVDDTQTIHFRSDDFAVAGLVAGVTLVFALPTGTEGIADYERYLGFQVRETAGQALTAGNVNAFLTLDPSGWKSYPDATN